MMSKANLKTTEYNKPVLKWHGKPKEKAHRGNDWHNYYFYIILQLALLSKTSDWQYITEAELHGQSFRLSGRKIKKLHLWKYEWFGWGETIQVRQQKTEGEM